MTLHISESSVFTMDIRLRGFKAYRSQRMVVFSFFRPDENVAKRLQRTCGPSLMPQVPTEMPVEVL